MLRLPVTFPFDPSRLPFFYGWVLAVVGTVGILMSIPGQTMGISVFTEDLLAVTGLSRLQFSNAYLVGTVTSGLLLPFGGRLIDRFGVRWMGFLASLALAASVLLLSLIDRVAGLLLPAGSGGGLFLLLAAAFTLLRFSGQGMLTLTGRTMTARWFDRLRGLVAACSGALIAFGFSAAPILLLAWIGRAGWRGAWREMALLLVVMGLVALLSYRDRPEDCGLRMDGAGRRGEEEAHGAGTPGQSAGPAPRELEARQAISTRTFWVVTLAIANLALVGTAITFHIVDLGGEAGMAPAEAVRIFLPVAVISVGTGFAVGYLIDRWSVVGLARCMVVVELVMFAAAGHMASPALRWLAIGTWGVASGFYGPMTAASMPRLFGRRHLGAISGMMTSLLVIFSALGPAILAYARQVAGSYRPGLYLCCLLPLGVLMLSLGAAPTPSGGPTSPPDR